MKPTIWQRAQADFRAQRYAQQLWMWGMGDYLAGLAIMLACHVFG